MGWFGCAVWFGCSLLCPCPESIGVGRSGLGQVRAFSHLLLGMVCIAFGLLFTVWQRGGQDFFSFYSCRQASGRPWLLMATSSFVCLFSRRLVLFPFSLPGSGRNVLISFLSFSLSFSPLGIHRPFKGVSNRCRTRATRETAVRAQSASALRCQALLGARERHFLVSRSFLLLLAEGPNSPLDSHRARHLRLGRHSDLLPISILTVLLFICFSFAGRMDRRLAEQRME
ncbi:hypothetical protein IWZ00DRAFT_274007 [Phyllosticta capitalensis]